MPPDASNPEARRDLRGTLLSHDSSQQVTHPDTTATQQPGAALGSEEDVKAALSNLDEMGDKLLWYARKDKRKIAKSKPYLKNENACGGN